MRLRHRHKLNHKLACVLFTLSLRHYSNIMQRIMLVYMMYLGAYFLLFERCLRLRLYRRFRIRAPHLACLRQLAAGAFSWQSWEVMWRWQCACAPCHVVAAEGAPRFMSAGVLGAVCPGWQHYLGWLLLLRVRAVVVVVICRVRTKRLIASGLIGPS